MEQFTFEKLEAWQKSRALVKRVYEIISKFPQTEKFGLSNQLGRAVISVPSNIAEGCGRSSTKERIHFFEIAYGSLMETLTQIIIASDLDFISKQEVEEVRVKILEVARIISGLRKSLLRKINSSK